MDRFYFWIEAKHILDRIYSSAILEKDFISKTTKTFLTISIPSDFKSFEKKLIVKDKKIHVFDFWKTIFKKSQLAIFLKTGEFRQQLPMNFGENVKKNKNYFYRNQKRRKTVAWVKQALVV